MKKKILILACHEVFDYRKELYEALGHEFEITIMVSKSIELKDCKLCIVPTYNLGPFKFQPSILKTILSNKFDKILIVANFSFVFNTLFLIFGQSRHVISWGFWPTKNTLANLLRSFIIKRGVLQIFYSQSHFEYYATRFPSVLKGLVAANTVYVDQGMTSLNDSYALEKPYLLFIGTLKKRKGLDLFLSEIKSVFLKYPGLRFKIIGDGPERHQLQSLVADLKITEQVSFEGSCTDLSQLSNYYNNAICEISPFQAGLSVLRAMGHGVPFVTLDSAISGGEKEAISNGETGFLCKDLTEMVSRIDYLVNNPSISSLLGKEAKKKYLQSYTMNNMIEQFTHAFLL